MNRGTIRDEIRRLISDTDTYNPRWSTAVLNARIDLAHDRIASLTRCIPYRYTTNTVANTAEYEMPDYFLEAQEVMILNDDGNYQVLTKKSERELDNLDSLWRSRSGTPNYWYQRINYIGLVEYPTSAKTNGLRVDMARLPTAFTADADIPFDSIPDLYQYHEVLCYDVAVRCAIDDKDKDKYAIFNKELDGLVKKIKAQVNEKDDETRVPNIYETLRLNNRRTRS